MGNHDFGHKDFFSEELNIEVLKTDLTINIDNKKFFLSHGDDKIDRSKKYLFLKAVLRNQLCQKLYSLLHPDIGIPLARYFSKKSRKTSSTKNETLKYDSLERYVKRLICGEHHNGDNSSSAFDYVIMGHSHVPQILNIERSNKTLGTYINLGS